MKILLLIAVSISSITFGQATEIPKNIFSVGTGVYNRGVVSFEHAYNWKPKDRIFLSLESSIGITSDMALGNFTVAPVLNFGESTNYLLLGIENKYLHNTYYDVVDQDWGFPFFDAYKYHGYAVAPFIGYNLVGSKWFNLKIRASLTILTRNFATQFGNVKKVNLRPGIGLSIGLFRRKKKST